MTNGLYSRLDETWGSGQNDREHGFIPTRVSHDGKSQSNALDCSSLAFHASVLNSAEPYVPMHQTAN